MGQKIHLRIVQTNKIHKMKRIIYLFVAICATLATEAQTIESVKTMLTLQQYTKAKEELDKGMGNAKFNSKPEAYMLKCCVYAALAMDNANKSTATGEGEWNEGGEDNCYF